MWVCIKCTPTVKVVSGDSPRGTFISIVSKLFFCVYPRCLSQMEGLFLKSVIAEFRSSGLEEATFGDVS